MKKTKNTVATIFKVYSVINFFACIFWLFLLRDDLPYKIRDEITTLWIATSIVVNFAIYAVGEVIQLLHEIKQNTKGATDIPDNSKISLGNSSNDKCDNFADSTQSNLYTCPSCGSYIAYRQQVCEICNQKILW